MLYRINYKFTKGYIAHPYWPEREKVVNIQKSSGMNRAKSDKNRIKALRDYIATIGLTIEDYDRLVVLADRQFYTVADVQGVEIPIHTPSPTMAPIGNQIIVPSHHIMSSLVNACDVATSAIRPCNMEQVRTLINASAILTGKTKKDGTWERFARPTDGSGKILSNQRALRTNDYIGAFDGYGTIEFDPDQIAAAKLKNFLIFAGRDIGVGASRKLGWGRFVPEFLD